MNELLLVFLDSIKCLEKSRDRVANTGVIFDEGQAGTLQSVLML